MRGKWHGCLGNDWRSRLRAIQASNMSSDSEFGLRQTLRFLRYYVKLNTNDPTRGSLLIEWSVKGLDQPVQQWCELGHTGHVNQKTGKPLKLGKNGHFRVYKDTLVGQWFIDEAIDIKKFSEAHSGFKKQLSMSDWAGFVYQTPQETKLPDGRVETKMVNRVKMHTVTRIEKQFVERSTSQQPDDSEQIPF